MTWVVKVVTGETIVLDDYYNQFKDAGSLFGMVLKGHLRQTYESVTTQGKHVVLIKERP